MQQYQSTPDFYREYIEHGWAKDAAAKAHKYIKRWKNKAGEWVYQYKKPKSNVSYANWNDQRAWRSEGIYGREEHRTAARYSRFMRYKDIQNAKKNAKNKRTQQAMANKIKTKTPMGSSNRIDKPYYRTEEFDFGNGIKVKKRGVVRTVKKRRAK